MTSTSRWKGLAALLLAFTLVAAACGGRDDSSDGGSDNGTDNGSNGEESTELASADDCENYDGTQGVTDDKILIGNSLPRSGLYSVFDKVRVGIEAAFAATNAEGGVDGRELELKSLDDGYEPQRTRANAETLVNSDGVFALLGGVGTENNEQVQQLFEEQGQCIPNLAVATGYPGFGDPERDPWIMNGLPSYGLEAIAFADYLKTNMPDATVAILSQNDSFGESYVEGFKNSIEGSDIEVVAEETFDPKTQDDPQGQVTTLANSGADALLLGLTGLPCPTAISAIGNSGWDPLMYVTLTCSSKVLMDIAGGAAEGAISTRATYDPADPGSADEPGVAEFKEKAAAAGVSGEDLNDLNVAAGWGFGLYLAQLLEASPELDRATVMNTAWFQQDVTFGLNLDGVVWSVDGPADPFGFNQLQFIVRTGDQWVPEGEVNDYSEEMQEQYGR